MSEDHLSAFLRFADAVQASAERAHRPAYTETCTCGGSVEVGRDATRADLRRIHANFLGRHARCPSPTPSRGDETTPGVGRGGEEGGSGADSEPLTAPESAERVVSGVVGPDDEGESVQ